MSIELKQAAQDAAEAIDWLLKNIRLDAPQLSGKAMGNAEKCASALRTALSQQPDNASCRSVQKRLEAQQPATGEPVGFVDFQGTVFWHDGPPTADSLLFAAKPVSHDKAKWCEYVAGMVFTWLEMQENLKEEDRCIKAIAGIIERRMWALLTTYPAPSVPDDVVRDAERYRWLADCNNYEAGLELIIDPKLTAHTLGEKIDAAMLAAK